MEEPNYPPPLVTCDIPLEQDVVRTTQDCSCEVQVVYKEVCGKTFEFFARCNYVHRTTVYVECRGCTERKKKLRAELDELKSHKYDT